MRTMVAAAVLVSMIAPALTQTQPTHSSAYPTFSTLSSAWAPLLSVLATGAATGIAGRHLILRTLVILAPHI